MRGPSVALMISIAALNAALFILTGSVISLLCAVVLPPLAFWEEL